MDGTYRVEKNGMAHFIQPSEVAHYAINGYEVYRPDGTKVSDVMAELSAIVPQTTTATTMTVMEA